MREANRVGRRWVAALQPLIVVAVVISTTRGADDPQDARLKPLRTLNDAYHPSGAPHDPRSLGCGIAAHPRAGARRLRALADAGEAPLDPVIHGKVERDGYTVEKVTSRAAPGTTSPAACIGRQSAGQSARESSARTGTGPTAGSTSRRRGREGADRDRRRRVPVGCPFPLQARMVQLARMGCVVFHYDMVGYADSTADRPPRGASTTSQAELLAPEQARPADVELHPRPRLSDVAAGRGRRRGSA